VTAAAGRRRKDTGGDGGGLLGSSVFIFIYFIHSRKNNGPFELLSDQWAAGRGFGPSHYSFNFALACFFFEKKYFIPVGSVRFAEKTSETLF